MRNKSKTGYYPIAVIIIIGLFVFFLTSKSWMHTKNDMIAATALGKPITNKDFTVTIYRWDYSVGQKMMEVELELTNKAPGEITYEFAAVSNGQGELPVESVANDDSICVLRINDIPSSWHEICLLINDSNNNLIQTYTNNAEVSAVGVIETLTVDQYIVNHYLSIMMEYEAEIDDLKKDIEECSQKIVEYEEKLAEVVKTQEFETEKEKQDSNSDISDYKNKIDTLNRTIVSDNEKIAEYEERIENIKRKIEA